MHQDDSTKEKNVKIDKDRDVSNKAARTRLYNIIQPGVGDKSPSLSANIALQRQHRYDHRRCSQFRNSTKGTDRVIYDQDIEFRNTE